MAPEAAGSKPVSHPILFCAPVAQLDRASDFESVRRGFESLQAYHNLILIRGVKLPGLR